MTSTTAAGSAIAISTGTPGTLNAAGYAALAWDNIGLVEKIGTIGKVFSKVEFQALQRGKDKLKGSHDNGALTPSMAYDETDPGQITLRAAADDSTTRLYPIRVTLPSGEISYFRGRVFGAPEGVEGADSVIMTTATIEICTPRIRVPSSTAPAPVFTTQPTISPTSGAVGTTFTANDGAATNSTSFTRRWLLGSTAIGTGTTVTPNAAGTLTLEVTATGTGGSTSATSSAVTVSAAPTPVSGNIFYMGDSRVASFYNDTSTKNNKNAGNHLVVANTQMGQRMVTIGNTAVAGQRSNEYNSSTSTMTASTAGTLIGLGVVNDIAQGRTGADAWTTVKAIIDAAIAAGKSVVWHTEPGAEAFTATQIGYRNDFNTALRAYAAANPQTIRVFDFAAAVLVDPTSTTSIAFKSGYSYDGTHLTNAGARQAGTAFAAWAATQIGGTQINLTTGTNLLANPGFTTATGGSTVTGVTGSVPASWGVVRVGSPTATVGTSVAPDSTGNQFDLAVTSTANSDRMIFQQLVTASGVAAVGDKIRWAVRVAVDAGAVNLRSVRGYMTAQFDLSGSSSNIQKFDMQPIATHLNTDGSAYVDLLSPEIMTVNKAGTTSFDRLDFSIAAEFSGAGSATYHVRQPQAIKV